jgi:eukaryotic-like serine/threonine-protein kinase
MFAARARRVLKEHRGNVEVPPHEFRTNPELCSGRLAVNCNSGRSWPYPLRMNRPSDSERHVFVTGEFRFDPVHQLLWRRGEEVSLPPRALGVLSALLEEPGAVVSKQALLDTVWNGTYVSETSLSEAVRRLRDAFEDDPQEPSYIQTVHRRGYRFIAPVTREPLAPPAVIEETATVDVPRPLWWPAAAIAAALATTIGIATMAMRTDPVREPVRFTIAPPAGHVEPSLPGVAVSPDGRHIVYLVRRDGETVLFHRDISGFTSREIPGTRGAMNPFFSPDGRRIGFFANGSLSAVPVAGGPAHPLVKVPKPFGGAAWGPDDTLIYAAGFPASLYRVRPGGVAKRLISPETARGEFEHRWPHLLPGGRHLLFTSWSTDLSDAKIVWLSLASGERRTVLTGAVDGRFVNGMLLSSGSERTLFGAPFDPETGRITGPRRALLSDVHVLEGAGIAQLAIGGRTVAYLPATPLKPCSLHRLTDGKLTPIPTPRRFYTHVQAGPRDAIATTIRSEGRSDVWLVNSGTGASSRLTFEGFNVDPVWSPDGEWIAFASKRGSGFHIYRRRVDGSSAPELLVASPHHQFPAAWSPDGRDLMLIEVNLATGPDLVVLDLETRKLRPWLATKAREVVATWSPDGRWVAYTSDESGTAEVYVRSYRNPGARWQLSSEGAIDVSWSEDGRSIVYRRPAGDRKTSELWSVPVNPTPAELNPGTPRPLHSARIIHGPSGTGGLVLITDPTEPAKPAELRVMIGW